MIRYLEQRIDVAQERAAFRAQLTADRAAGIERFAAGLDAALEPERERLASQGGLTGSDEAELGWPPRGERG